MSLFIQRQSNFPWTAQAARLTVDAAMGTVSAPSLLHGLVDLNVRDVHAVRVQTLHLH